MRSSADRWRALARVVLLAVAAAALSGAARAQDDDDDVASEPHAAASATPSTDPRARHVQAALDGLRADPLLSGRHKEHRLRWKNDPADKPADEDNKSLLAWLIALGHFLNDTSRLLMYGLIAGAAVLVVVGVHRVARLRGWRRRVHAPTSVSHVRDLDVRPESLPDDVGAAAWALWQAGQVPAALSLLYRGALSRLIHRFAVPITASATEGECLELAQGRLEATALRYVTQVVRAWQASTYGGRALSLAMGESLCSGFGQRLDAVAGKEAA